MEYKCKCVICRHYGQEQDDSDKYETASVFDKHGREIRLELCSVHAVQLFRNGQKKFLMGHYKILLEVMDSDDTDFLEILEETVKKNMNKIY